MKKYLVKAFIEMLNDNKSAFLRTSYSFLLNWEEAEDAVSNAVLKAYQHLPQLRGIGKMRSWFYGILVNECKDVLRKQKQLQYVDFDIVETTVADTDEDRREDMSELYQFIYQLEPEFREVIILFYFEGFRGKEIAKMLGIPEGTVKSRLSRAKRKLKSFLEDYSQEV